MAHRKGNRKSVGTKRQRRTQNVALTEEQRESLIRLWQEYHGGTKAFAKRMAEVENSGDAAASNSMAAKKRALHRIEDCDTGVSQEVFKTIADVLEITTEELIEKISAPNPGKAISALVGPWITDEKALAEYRRVYYGYYITKQGTDYFWMHHQIDFSAPYKGCLHATKNYGIDRPIYYKVYAYVFRQMLVVITKSDEERNQQESLGIYHDFRRPIREHVGHFGIHLNEDWNGDFGLGASILLRQPLEGTEKEGRQSPAMCKTLTQYWKDLDGERCNRLLHLFGFGPFSRSANAAKRQDSVRVSGRQASASKKK
jgi:hypothetical protein